MLVIARPSPKFKLLLRWRKISSSSLDNFIFFNRGRDALISGLHALGVESGATIIVPAYICNSITDSLENFGYRVVFLDINKDLQFDINKLSKTIKSERAKIVLVVHYFGFSSNISEVMQMCQLLNVGVVEDCSHSFLSENKERRVGFVGDMSIFSLRKTLPCEDGGALRINSNSKLSYKIKYCDNNKAFQSSFYLTTRLIESIVAFVGWPNIYSSFISNTKIQIRRIIQSDTVANQELELCSTKPSRQLIHHLSDESYLREIINTSRANYKELLRAVLDLGLLPFCSNLDLGCVPQYFPLYDKKNIIVNALRNHGIGAIRWPWHEMPKEVTLSPSVFPVANELDSNLALIPIHQGIKGKHMRKIILALSRCNV